MIVLLGVLLGAGCQSYTPEPIHLQEHQKNWQSRSADSKKVRQFLRQLKDDTGQKPDRFNVDDGLSLSEAERVALVYNPDLRTARLRAGVARASALHAGLWSDPEFSLDVLRIMENVPDPWVVGSAISFTIPLSGRLDAAKDEAEANRKAELRRVARKEWEVRRKLRNTWMRWSAAKLRLKQNRRLVRALEDIVSTTRKLEQAGELKKTEATLFRIEHISRKNRQRKLQGEVEQLQLKLKRLLGLSPSATPDLVPNLNGPDLPGTTSKQDVRKQLEDHPALARLKAEYRAAEQHLRTEINKQYPDLTFGPQYEDDTGQSRVGFIGAFPIPILNANKQGIATARAERRRAKAVYETTYERMVSRLKKQRTIYNTARTNRKRIESELVPMVDRQLEDARRLVRMGEADPLLLLESLLRAQQIKFQLIDVKLKEAQATNALRYLLGATESL